MTLHNEHTATNRKNLLLMVSRPLFAGSLQSHRHARLEFHGMAVNAEDAQLVDRIRSGDRGALEELFNEHGGAVKGVAARVLRDDALADDVVQDTFVSLWSAPNKYDPARGTLRTFLLTIAHRRAVDIVRSEVARTRREQKPPDPDYTNVEEEVWSRDLSATVREALNDLSEGEREAISLAYFGGLSYVEVAKKLDQPEGTVKSRIRSGMKKLSISLAGAGA